MTAADRTAEIVSLAHTEKARAWRDTLAIEMQQQIIGWLLLHPDAMAKTAFLRPEHMPTPEFGTTLGIMRDLAAAGESVTPMAIVRRSEGAVDLKVLLALVRDAWGLCPVEDYALELYLDWHYRRAIEIAEKARSNHDPSALLRHHADLDAVLVQIRGASDDRVSAASAMDAMLVRIAEIADGAVDDGILSTGIHTLDDVMGGYRPGELVVIAGRPAMGKTIAGCHAARIIAGGSTGVYRSSAPLIDRAGEGRPRRGVLIMSLEVDAGQIAARLASDEALRRSGRRIEFGRIMRGDLQFSEQEIVYEAAHALRLLPIEIDARGGLGVAEIAAAARLHAAKCAAAGTPLGAVIIDYLGLMRHGSGRTNGSTNRAQDIGDTTGALKALAKELGVAVILLVQLNRDVEKRDIKKPTLADLRDSGAIEQDADVIIFLYRQEYYDRQAGKEVVDGVRNTLEMIVAKNRPGKTGVCVMACDIACNAIRNLGDL